MLSAFPPSPCGVANYAGEQVARLAEEGRVTTRIGMTAGGDCEFRAHIGSVRGAVGFLVLAMRMASKVLFVHYTDEMFLPLRMPGTKSRRLARLLQALAIRVLCWRSGHASVIVHEMYFGATLTSGNRIARGLLFCGFDEILFHTGRMRTDFLHGMVGIRKHQTGIIDHTRFLRRRYGGGKNQARMDLGLNADGILFLCLGFLHEAKGFDDAVEAFNACCGKLAAGTELHIVGGFHEGDRYAEKLTGLVDASAGVLLHAGYLEDLRFDMWLAAADYLVLPYHGVASSGVGARAELYGTKVIVRDLPNLREQFPQAEWFRDVAGLSCIMIRRAAKRLES